MDLGAPISYLVLRDGTPVYGPDESELGQVEHVLAAVDEDIFDGLVIDCVTGPGGFRFADADQVERICERGVVLSVGPEGLHEPTENAATMSTSPDDAGETVGKELERKLKRAWDYISGNY